MAELSVQIGADIKELQKKLKQSEKDLKGLERVSAKSGANISKVGAKASKGFDKLGKSSANATPAVQEFSRILQDAPYGIQGVSNNIQQLTSQFGYLSKKAGGTKAALKAMLGTMTGPAGILLAVSAITSLLVSYGDKLKFAAGATDGLAKATNDYVAGAKTEISTLETLLSIAKNEANSKQVRQGAIEEINKKYSKYLGNLDLESIKTDNVTKSVESLSKALVLKAKVQGLQAFITEKTADSTEDVYEAELKRNTNFKTLNKQVNDAIRGNSLLNTIIGNVKGDRARINALIGLTKRNDDVGSAARNAAVGVGIALDAFRESNKEVEKLNNKLKNSLEPLNKLEEEYKKAQLSVNASVTSVDDGAVIIKATNKNNEAKLKSDKAYTERKRKLFASIDNDLLKSEEESINNFIKRWEKVEVDADPFSNMYIGINDEFQKIIDSQNRLQQNSQIMSNVVGSSFDALSNQITTSLQTGNAVVDAFTQSLISSFAQIATAGLQSLITEKLIAVGKNQINRSVSSGNAITVATSAAASLGPLGAIALPGLLATQLGIVNGAFAGLASFAKGGFSGDNNLAYLNKNELVLRPFEQAALLNAFRGTGMSKIKNNTQSDSSSNIVGEVVLRGQNQVVQLRRAEKKMKRYYN